MLLLGLALPHAAQAQAIAPPSGCSAYASPGVWPNGFTSFCAGATSSDQSTMQGAIAQMHGNGVYAMEKAGVAFFIFGTEAQYATAFPASKGYPTPASTDFGVTYFGPTGGNNVPVFSAIFKKNSAGTTNPNIPNTSAFQAGRSLDAMLGYVNNGGVFVLPQINVSSTTTTPAQSNFNDDLTIDWGTTTLFNGLSPCKTAGNANGVFTGQKDPRTGHGGFVCSGSTGDGMTLNSGYSGTNEAILQTIWPTPFQTSTTRAPFLAEEIADTTLMGQSNTQATGLSTDYYFNPANTNQFLCTQGYLTSVLWRGVLPTTAGSGCKTSWPISTSAVQLFDQTSKFPGLGYFFDGIIPSDGIASEIQQALDKLGTLGGTVSAPAIQSKLKSFNSYLYLFSGQTTFSNAFTNAGLSTTNMTLTGVNAFTAPIGSGASQVWYTVINEGSSAGSSSTKQAYIAAHELGHTVDFNTGQPSHSANQAGFDLAMQNDWLSLDYATYPGTLREPCWVKGQVPQGGTQPATYTGPLVNLTDPYTSGAFCANGVLSSTEQIWAGKKNSYIIDNIADYPLTETREIRYQSNTPTIGNTPGVTAQTGWREWFAQSFAIMAAADIGGASNVPVLDQVVKNGYFACTGGTGGLSTDGTTLTKGWLYWVYTQQTQSLPAACTAAMPNGWTEYQPVDNN